MRRAAEGRDHAAGPTRRSSWSSSRSTPSKLPGQLSGGQQQRVAIARAVVLEPSLVLMDEPLSNLDAKLRLEMRTEIRRLHQSLGLTTVYVTHDQEEALSLADRLVVLREGRVQQIGTPEELHTKPANWHVADFMGYRNLLPLTAAGRDRRRGDGRRSAALTLPARRSGAVAPGDDVVAGVRPEDVQLGRRRHGLHGARSRWSSTRAASSRSRSCSTDGVSGCTLRTDAGRRRRPVAITVDPHASWSSRRRAPPIVPRLGEPRRPR